MRLNKWIIESFDLNEAPNNEDYEPTVITKMEPSGENVFLMTEVLNDSIWLCMKFNFKGRGKSFYNLARFNMLSGQLEAIDNNVPQGEGYSMTVMKDDDRIFLGGRTQDKIKITDLNGNVLQEIKGPNYSESLDQTKEFHQSSTSGAGKFFVPYNDKHWRENSNEILVFDKDGNYESTFKLDVPITGVCYNENLNRLYVTTIDEPQFGYIQF